MKAVARFLGPDSAFARFLNLGPHSRNVRWLLLLIMAATVVLGAFHSFEPAVVGLFLSWAIFQWARAFERAPGFRSVVCFLVTLGWVAGSIEYFVDDDMNGGIVILLVATMWAVLAFHFRPSRRSRGSHV